MMDGGREVGGCPQAPLDEKISEVAEAGGARWSTVVFSVLRRKVEM